MGRRAVSDSGGRRWYEGEKEPEAYDGEGAPTTKDRK